MTYSFRLCLFLNTTSLPLRRLAACREQFSHIVPRKARDALPCDKIQVSQKLSVLPLSLIKKGLVMNELASFYGPNAGYVLELYDRYRQDPNSVDPQTRAIFETWSPPDIPATRQDGATPQVPAPSLPVSQIVAASALTHAIRSRGHLGA